MKKFSKFFGTDSPVEPARAADVIEIQSQVLPILYRRHDRARRYVLRLAANKTVTVTLPRGGSMTFARRFVASRRLWLEKQLGLLQAHPLPPPVLHAGMEVLWRGRLVKLQAPPDGTSGEILLDGEHVRLAAAAGNLRPAWEEHLRRLAQRELASRTEELAREHGTPVRRVLVRDQKTRWGSCSSKGTVCLNWRLIQAPDAVRDYIILHELMHLRCMNHSPRFWAEVEKVCPDYRAAEAWLKKNHGQLRP